MINKRIKIFSIFYYQTSKMNWEEKRLAQILYESLFENKKEELKKFFND